MQNQNSNRVSPRHRSGTRVLYAVLIAATLGLFVTGFSSMQDRRAEVRELAEQRGNALARLAADACTEPAMCDDVLRLDALANHIVRANDEIMFVRVASDERTVLAQEFAPHAGDATVLSYQAEMRAPLPADATRDLEATRTIGRLTLGIANRVLPDSGSLRSGTLALTALFAASSLALLAYLLVPRDRSVPSARPVRVRSSDARRDG